MDAIGMSGVTLHSLRHTHASMLIASGVDIITVSRRLGHCSPKVTLEVYGHLINGGDDRAAQIVGARRRKALKIGPKPRHLLNTVPWVPGRA